MRTVRRLLIAAALGAVAAVLVIGAVSVAALYYANLAFDYDPSGGFVPSAIIVLALVSPFVGAAAGLWLAHSKWQARPSDDPGPSPRMATRRSRR